MKSGPCVFMRETTFALVISLRTNHSVFIPIDWAIRRNCQEYIPSFTSGRNWLAICSYVSLCFPLATWDHDARAAAQQSLKPCCLIGGGAGCGSQPIPVRCLNTRRGVAGGISRLRSRSVDLASFVL